MIKESVISYKKLTNYHLKIVVCKNDIHKNICINFCDSDFYHLAGLHKLKDSQHMLRGSKTGVFNKLLSSDSLCERLEQSKQFEEITIRLELCGLLKDVLIKKTDIYSYKRNASNFSKIEADYVIRFYYKKQQCYLFLVKRDKEYHVCNSLICEKRNMVLFNQQYKIKRKELSLNKNSIKNLPSIEKEEQAEESESVQSSV